MAGVFSTIDLSGTGLANGGKVKISQTAGGGSGFTAHTAGGTDFINLWAYNLDNAADQKLYVEIDGTSDPLVFTVPKAEQSGYGASCILLSKKLASTKTIVLYAATTNKIVVFGDGARES